MNFTKTMKTLSDILNGINSVGLGEISDVGLPISEWFVVPKAFLKIPKVTITKESDELKAFNSKLADYVKGLKDRDNSHACAIDNGVISFKDGGEAKIEVEDLKDEEFQMVAATIYDHYSKLDPEKRTLKTALNLMALDYGFIQLTRFDEITIIDNIADLSSDAKSNVLKVTEFIEMHLTRLTALMVAVGINHWMSNHCLGSIDKSGLLEKVWNMCPFASVIKEKGNTLKSTLYNLLHSVSKRNVLYSVSDQIRGLTGVFTPGMRDIKRLQADKAFTLRLSTLPAGNKKIDIALALIKFAHENELLTLSRSIVFFKDILILKKKATEAGVLAHIGAHFYSFKSLKEGKYIDFVNTKVEETIADYGNMLLAVASGHTLAVSPIITRAVEASVRKPIADLAKAVIKSRTERAEEFVKRQIETKITGSKETTDIEEMAAAASKYFESIGNDKDE